MSKCDFLKELGNLPETVLPAFQGSHLKTTLPLQPFNDNFLVSLNMELQN
jgi:hypothetical protein